MLGSVDKLQRRNQDYKLLETIKQVGVQNYSLLSRLTGINAETIRYKVNRHLTKLGLIVQDDGGLLFALAVTVFAAAALVVWLRRTELPFIGDRFASQCDR